MAQAKLWLVSEYLHAGDEHMPFIAHFCALKQELLYLKPAMCAGLLAVDIVSHWTWASILLTSVSYGYFYGITGSYWCVAFSSPIPLLGVSCCQRMLSYVYAVFPRCLAAAAKH